MEHLFRALFVCAVLCGNLLVAENCQTITDSDLISAVQNARYSGGESSPQDLVLMDSNINCQVVSSQKNTFSSISTTTRYNNPNNNQVEVVRLRLTCVSAGGNTGWNPVNSFGYVVDDTEINELLNSVTDTQCSSCTKNVYECNACNDACNEGFGYCTGSGSQDCCNYYDEDECVASCQGNQSPDPTSFDCKCIHQFYMEPECTECTLQQSDCQNGGTADTTLCQCTCTNTGYSGITCTTDIDECATNNPCSPENSNGCTNNNGSYVCHCREGFNGKNCENNINDCTSSSCLNGGTCNDGIVSFTCTCVPGYDGDTCQVDINECEVNPCQNGGTCSDRVNGYVCSCVDQYQGTNCDEDFDECSSRPTPCLNDGRCNNIEGGFTCDCVGRWTNPTCDVCLIDDCSMASCSGSDFECLECVGNYTTVYPDRTSCVTCDIGNCTRCSDNNFCVGCANGLVTNGTICSVRPFTRSGLEVGAILGIIIALVVIIAIVTFTIIVVAVISIKIRAAKPIQYGPKNQLEKKVPIVLELQSEI